MFLEDMLADPYFPSVVVRRGQEILERLCEDIESTRPASNAAVLALSGAATTSFSHLENDFIDHGSELETAARECIATEFALILDTYGFTIDIETAISNRTW